MSSAASKKVKRDADRADRILVGEVLWTLVDDEGCRILEYFMFRSKPTQMRVDTDEYCYRMTCACGRDRYAKPNTLHEITLCRICQYNHRLARRRQRTA